MQPAGGRVHYRGRRRGADARAAGRRRSGASARGAHGRFAGSKIMEMHGRRMLDDNFQPGFRARLHLKDARIVLDTARDLGSRCRAFEPVAAALERLVEGGGGDLDHSALVTLVRRGARTRPVAAGRLVELSLYTDLRPAPGAHIARHYEEVIDEIPAWPTGWGFTRCGRPSSTAWTTATSRRSWSHSPPSRGRPNGSAGHRRHPAAARAPAARDRGCCVVDVLSGGRLTLGWRPATTRTSSASSASPASAAAASWRRASGS